MAGGKGIWVLGGVGILAYLTRNSWMATAEADFPSLFGSAPLASGASSTNTTAPLVTTNNQPITINTPGSVPVGTQGCFQYNSGVAGAGPVITCPPGVSPPPTTPPPNNCGPGFTMDAAGICTRYTDAVLLAQINSIPWSGTGDIPAEQISRIDPQILSTYTEINGVNPGTVLAYMLGLGDNPVTGQITNGDDGRAYLFNGTAFVPQGSSTSATSTGLSGIRMRGPRRLRLGLAVIGKALPITTATLIEASSDPKVAQLVGSDPRAMLTADQWNFYYAQASGILQAVPLSPPGDPHALMSAIDYQNARKAAGLATEQKMGTLRTYRKGAFPLGQINQWVPPGNRTIFNVPGRGTVAAAAGGKLPKRKMGLIHDGGGNHRSARSPFPRPSFWRTPDNDPAYNT